MPSIPTLAAVSLTMLAASVQWASALGCYGGFKFNKLHGGEVDLTQEVINDIHTTCTMVAGRVIKSTEPFWHCTNWERTIPENIDCYSDCMSGCEAIKESARFGCTLACGANKDCQYPPEGGFHHIEWAIEVRDGQTEHEITYEQCSEAFNIERSACQSGSEQNHHGFWFRIDPEGGAC